MKRFVSYLYSIYNNQKIHNAGFARIELRTGRNRIEIHLKENGYAGKTGTVYLFIRKKENIQGISIGNITFRNNQADFRYEQAEENIGQTPWQIMQMNGILIIVENRAAFLSQWDEQPVDTTRFEEWNIDKQKENEMDSGTESQEAVRKYENEEITKNEENAKKDVRSVQNTTILSENTTMKNENTTLDEANDVNNEKIMPEMSPHYSESISVEHTVNNNVLSEAALQSELNLDSAAGQLQTGNAFPVREPAEDGKESLYTGQTKAGNVSPDAARTDDQNNAGQNTVSASEQQSNIRTAELQPQPQNQWNQTWRYMLRTYPVLNQFTDKNNVLCVRIEIKDVRILPEKYWSMINNSFLLHGFFNYRHLAFGRIDQNWFIGVPGIYQNQEHVMASIFGFPDFLPQKEKNERGEQPGYWYRILESV